ncbi:hypothetical protein [Arthrobacter sp. UYCo732]|uniref:hypothetical protein n=1 Tax=Arthrobacter sp. UYCo732 TaxID=3156336 RepID=UPI00339998BB
MSTKTAVATIAARLLGLRFNDAVRNSSGLPAEAATHFWDPAGEGASVIVGSDGTYLWADSSVGSADHLAEFAAGRRTGS